GPAKRDERRHGNEAAVALREAGTRPHVAEHNLLGQLAELRKNILDLADGRRRQLGCHCEPPGEIDAGDSIMQRMDDSAQPESTYAWMRLAASLALMTLGGVAMYGVVVVLPLIQADFGVTRAEASLPYTLTMLGFGFGGILMGTLADRFGVIVP